MIKKDYYTPPMVAVFTVQTEGVICGSNFGTEGAPGDVPSFNDYPDF